jgi:cytoskeletal protein CcmA (bactofilin family)
MFTNKGNRPTETNVPPFPEPTPQRRPPSRSGIASIIANGVKITGTIDADGAEIQVDGEVEGNIRGGSLTVGDTGMVKGDVISESVTVHGRVEGSVRARKVVLARNAHVLGDIVHQSLSVEMGAVFEGQCRYLQDPLSQSGPGAPAAPQVQERGSAFGGGSGSVFGEPAIVTGTT